MRKYFTPLLAAAFLTLATSAIAQTIHRVNNNPGVTLGANMYSSLQAAHDAASNGDIIYVEGSQDSYGNLVCSKALTIVGTGYLLNENHIYQESAMVSKLGDVNFRAGSENSVIEGFRITGTFNITRASNITVRRNYIDSYAYLYTSESGQQTLYTSISNITFLNNLFAGVSANPSKNGAVNYTISNLTIKNNRMSAVYYDNNSTNANLILSGAIVNNVITYGIGKIFNTSVHNNIFTEATNPMLDLTGSNNTYSNNLAADVDVLPAGNGNVNGILLANTFLGFTGNTEDTQWKLKAGSPAIGAGVGGVDAGMYGGATPYVLSGIPANPTINSFNTTGVGSSSTPLSVTISTKSNN